MNGIEVQLDHVDKSYVKGGRTIPVLTDCHLTLSAGEQVSIVGPSGCGKSTFLHLLGMLDRPSKGTIRLGGRDITTLSPTERDRMRNRSVGFVFQAHNLLAEHSALQNVMVPVRLAGASVSVAQDRSAALLRAVGLGARLTHKPGELSGGEQQRVAIARAMVMGPGLILADEPTGNLDPKTSNGVFERMLEMAEQLGSTLIVVTHSHDLATRFPRRLKLDRGFFEEVGT